MSDLAIGTAAPDFQLPTSGGEQIQLSALKGGSVVVYFYPKDNTPGCTTEAIDFSALKPDFDAINCTIIGISPDSVRKHDNFTAKHDLKVILAADEEKQAIEAYGCWVEKKMYGKTYMGVERSTFLIDSEGNLAQIWRKVKVKNHAQDVLEAAQKL
ncbi:MAG: thioredoxin-dependent thiol peroxidase [Cohaesibacter sp.]|jgi:peroxiredoxin Q/BCP|nr:thioredoxin-dependent thiol peroxidase [Cohaesibacter sp.]